MTEHLGIQSGLASCEARVSPGTLISRTPEISNSKLSGIPMHAKHLLAVVVAIYIASATSVVVADQAADEATIRANAAKYVESYNRRDSKTMASMWSPEA